MSQNSNVVTSTNAISLNPHPQGTAILIGGGGQNLQAHQQMGQLNATTMIQLPTSINPIPTIAGNSSNLISTSTNPNANTTTFILNPSTNALQQQPQAHQQTAQIINTSQINQMIAASPLIAAQQSTPQPLQQYQLQAQPQQQQQAQVKLEEPQMSNGIRVPNLPSSNGFTATQQTIAKTNGTMEHPKHEVSASSITVTNGPTEKQQSKNLQNLHPVVVLDKQRLQELVQEVDPNEQLEDEVEDVLLSIADDFIDSLVSSSCMIARHRKSQMLEVKDVQLALEKNWNMWIPGFGVDGVVGVFSGTTGTGQGTGPAAAAAALSKPKKCLATEAHKQRLALIKKTLKKF